MAELKTQPNEQSVESFLSSVEDAERSEDCHTVLKLMKKITRQKPKMWGESIVGFGTYHYKYASGREGDWFVTGFSPRKQNLTIYIMRGMDAHKDALKKLGKHRAGRGCLYIKRLSDIDQSVLSEMIKTSVAKMKSSARS
jgi:hypothetical protein